MIRVEISWKGWKVIHEGRDPATVMEEARRKFWECKDFDRIHSKTDTKWEGVGKELGIRRDNSEMG